MAKPCVSVIVLSYNSMRYIERCLATLMRQDYDDLEILVVINGSNDGSAEYIKEHFRRFKNLKIYEPGENLWFSRGMNYGIARSRGEYILALNQDTVMEPNFISRIVKTMEADRRLGSVTGKLLYYNYEFDSKTRILDSTGLEIFKTRRVIDRGQWEADEGQYDLDREVFGASGAAAMYRRSALEDAKVPRADGSFEYFDEDFEAYKEDVDLAWRLQIFGYRCQYVPGAVIYHGRSVGRSWPSEVIRFILNRFRQSRLVRKLSFKNHYLMMVKNEIPQIFWRQIVYVFARELLLLIYSILFEQFQIFAVADFFRQLPEARRKRRYIMAKLRVKPEEVLSLFH